MLTGSPPPPEEVVVTERVVAEYLELASECLQNEAYSPSFGYPHFDQY